MTTDERNRLAEEIHARMADMLGKRYASDVRLRVAALIERYATMTREELVVEAVENCVSAMLMTTALANQIKATSPFNEGNAGGKTRH